MTTVVVPLSTATADSTAPTVKVVVSYSSGMFYGSVFYGTAVYGALPTTVVGVTAAPTQRAVVTMATGSGSFYGSAVYGVATYVGVAAIRAAFPLPTVQLVIPVSLLSVTGQAFSVSVYVKVVLIYSGSSMTAGYYFDVFGLINLLWVDNQGAESIFVEFRHEDGRIWSANFAPGGESTIDVSSGGMFVYFDVENESAYVGLLSVIMRDPA